MSEQVNVKIGLEIHAPLKTKQKLFCPCRTDYWKAPQPNTNTCPVCTGMPGSKPYPINEQAIRSVVKIARLLECKVVKENIFVKRKHYNYPDLPSGYQRTSEPIGVGGNVDGVGLWEVHLEEDPGRYDLKTGYVDYNRSGVPLIEIVSAPDMRSPDDARRFMRSLVNILKYSESIIEVGGVMRADVNISIEGGARVEIKNVNSVAGAFKAIQYEIIRQKGMMRRGAQVKQETRGYNEKTMITVPQRSKETAADYRYIPDPDIPPQLMEDEFIYSIELPETPQLRMRRLINEKGIREDMAQTIVRDKDLADLFEELIEISDKDLASTWVCGEVLGQLNYRGQELSDSKVNTKMMVELLDLLKHKRITENVGKQLLQRVMDSGESPKEVVEKEGLGVISSEDALSGVVDEVLKENPDAVKDYGDGQKNAINYLMGQVMKKMKGQAENKTVTRLLLERL